jgi:hypothetical protein
MDSDDDGQPTAGPSGTSHDDLGDSRSNCERPIVPPQALPAPNRPKRDRKGKGKAVLLDNAFEGANRRKFYLLRILPQLFIVEKLWQGGNLEGIQSPLLDIFIPIHI